MQRYEGLPNDEWEYANNYFARFPIEVKLCRKSEPNLKCSYMKINNEIYRIDESVGAGSNGRVKSITNIKGEKFALKIQNNEAVIKRHEVEVLRSLGVMRGEAVRDFYYARSLKLEHGCTAKVFSKHYTVLNYVEGRRLSVVDMELTLTQKLLIVLLAIQKITSLHQQNIIHGDPNIGNYRVIVDGNNIKLNMIDYGASKLDSSDKLRRKEFEDFCYCTLNNLRLYGLYKNIPFEDLKIPYQAHYWNILINNVLNILKDATDLDEHAEKIIHDVRKNVLKEKKMRVPKSSHASAYESAHKRKYCAADPDSNIVTTRVPALKLSRKTKKRC